LDLGARDNLPSVVGSVSFGLFIAMVTIVAAAAIATILLFAGLDWAPHMHTVGMSIAFAGIALGGIVTGSRAGSRGWLVGLVTGGCTAVVCLILYRLIGAKGMVWSLVITRVGLACLVGLVGGALGVNLGGR